MPQRKDYRTVNKPYPNTEKFVRAYMEVYKKDLGRQELAKLLDMPPTNISARKYYLRKVGIILPNLRNDYGSRINVELLRKIIADIEKEESSGVPPVPSDI